ncbi:MAG: hypothetical protein Kow0022_16580 [Phycisphaerales bacterium]
MRLADEPQSIPGKSAGMARDLASQMANRDAQTGAVADQLAGSNEVEVGGLKFPIPQGWQSVTPSNNMRAAELHVQDAVAAFSMAGGSVEANIDRWAGQFVGGAEPKTEQRIINGMSVTLVEMQGTYLDGGMFGTPTQRPDYSMLAAILPGGQMQVFVKLTGPTATIDRIYEQWNEMINGVHR